MSEKTVVSDRIYRLFNEAFLTEHEACFTHEVASLMKRALRHIRNASLNESALEDLLHDGSAGTSYLQKGKCFVYKTDVSVK